MQKTGLGLTMIVAIALLFGLAADSAAASKQELIVNRKAEGVSLDPAKTTAMEDYAVMANLYSSLFRFKPNSFELRPDLALDYKTSSDGKFVSFNLRKGVKWHKGYGEFTSEDVKFTIDRVLNPATQSRFATNFANIERVETDGPYIVNFYLKAPDATLLQRLTVTRPSGGLIVSKKAVTELGDKYASQPIGTGPFVFESHVPREKVVLVANKEYYEGPPKLERVTFVPIADETTAAMALESGDIHVSQFENIELLESYRKHKNLQIVTGGRVTDHMYLMNTRKAPFDNVKVRQAMAYGINRDEIIAGIFSGYADKPTGVIHPDMFGYSKDVKTYPYDPAKAKALLKEAGYPNGFKTEVVVLTYGNWQKVNELIKAQLGEDRDRHEDPDARAGLLREGPRQRYHRSRHVRDHPAAGSGFHPGGRVSLDPNPPRRPEPLPVRQGGRPDRERPRRNEPQEAGGPLCRNREEDGRRPPDGRPVPPEMDGDHQQEGEKLLGRAPGRVLALPG